MSLMRFWIQSRLLQAKQSRNPQAEGQSKQLDPKKNHNKNSINQKPLLKYRSKCKYLTIQSHLIISLLASQLDIKLFFNWNSLMGRYLTS